MTPMTLPLRLFSRLLICALPCLAHAVDVEQHSAFIVSEGARLHADVYSPKPAPHPLPTIIMSHGWGGTAAMLRSQATDSRKPGISSSFLTIAAGVTVMGD